MPKPAIHYDTSIKKTLLTQADRCVKCGLCSAQCPTYRLEGSENESPRGRIALAQALASEQLEDTTLAENHIDNCLVCQRCEKICPSGVKFGEIVSGSRALLAQQQKQPYIQPTKGTVKWIAKRSHRDWQKIATIAGALKKIGTFRLLPHLLPQLTPISGYISAPHKKTKTNQTGLAVSLFTGCTSHVLDANNLADAHRLLTLCGYEVSIPEQQVCCGTLPRHKGLLDTAKQCEEINTSTFNNPESPIVFLATACGAALKSYHHSKFTSRTRNITAFLNEENALKNRTFSPSTKRILIHEPCSEKNALRETGNTQTLLANIPNAEIITLKEATGCCGAAGDYLISHAEKANAIREPLVNDITAINPDIIATTNYTCGIHLKNGLDQKGLDIPVMHPIKLLLQHITQ